MTLENKDIGIRKSDFVAKTQFLYSSKVAFKKLSLVKNLNRNRISLSQNTFKK